jgi:hypothetical protein
VVAQSSRSGLSERAYGHSLHVVTRNKELFLCCTISIHDTEKLQLPMQILLIIFSLPKMHTGVLFVSGKPEPVQPKQNLKFKLGSSRD